MLTLPIGKCVDGSKQKSSNIMSQDCSRGHGQSDVTKSQYDHDGGRSILLFLSGIYYL